jgi:ubiquinone/menaquinone biosynthesis C-methylase UbiE
MTTNSPPPTQAEAQARITAFWDTSGDTYDAQPGHGLHAEAERAAWLDALRELFPAPPADVLDVGCGTGFLALLLAELGHRVTGVDLSEGMLAAARAKAAGFAALPAFAVGDAIAPPLPDGSFDAVTNRHLLWTLTDPARAFANWYRLLRPGGRLVVIDGLWWMGRPAAEEPEEWEQEHYTAEVQASLPLMHAQSMDPIVALAEAAGFTEVRITGLAEIERIEQANDPTREREPQPRYVLSAVRLA